MTFGHEGGGALNEEQRGSSLSTEEQLRAAKLDQRVRELADKVRQAETIPMRIPCPGTVPDGHGGLKVCGALHIDEGEFATKPHHTHSCQECGHTWRPAVVATVGVRFLPGFKNEAAEKANEEPNV